MFFRSSDGVHLALWQHATPSLRSVPLQNRSREYGAARYLLRFAVTAMPAFAISSSAWRFVSSLNRQGVGV
jgi:hypothetical protein